MIAANAIAHLSTGRSLSVCLLLVFFATSVDALDPHTLVSQYGHTAWLDRDGFVTHPASITQTTDGYIWIGTSSGLVRFDGITFTRWTPPAGQSLPARGVSSLLGARDGSLWIGTSGGLGHLKDGTLFTYTSGPDNAGISVVIEDQKGTIWVTRYRVTDAKGPLCRVAGKELECYGKKDGLSAKYGIGMAEDSSGNIWFGSQTLCRWTPDASGVCFEEEFKNVPGDGVTDVAAGEGGVWAALDGVGPQFGVRRFAKGRSSSYAIPGFHGADVRSHTLFVDRNNTLWIGTESDGLYHIHDGAADHYGHRDGLSGNSVASVFEDREGNIWVTTDRGIDLFRDAPVATYSATEGVTGGDVHSVLARSDGSVLVAIEGALDIIRGGHISVMDARHGLPGQDPGTMTEDRVGRVWMGIDGRLVTYQGNLFSEVKKANGRSLGNLGNVLAISEDVDHVVWALTNVDQHLHLIRIDGRGAEEDTPLDSSLRQVRYLAADRQSGVWLAGKSDQLAHYCDGHLEVISLQNTNRSFLTYSLTVDSANIVWVATNRGLYLWRDGRLNVLDSRNGLPCTLVYAAIQDNSGSTWLYAACGLMKISASEFATWLEVPESRVSVTTLDALDGVQAVPGSISQPNASRSLDGRLWFASASFVQVIDPNRSFTNTIPPPVHVETVIADHKSYEIRGQMTLPPLKSELEIDYTALSFVVPRKVKFRYKLEGQDSEWHDAGTRRQAFYNDLRPGNYHFRVVACNNSGVWNQAGTTLDFSIAPAWYQTNWFRFSCVVGGILLVWGLYRFRVKQVANAMSVRFDERLAERTRMARELHDTLLQTIQGSKLVADDALEKSSDPDRTRRALQHLSEWLGRAAEEGRAALNSLRTSTTQRNDLAESFQRAIEECRLHSPIEASFAVVGETQDMHPVVRDEVFRIGYEAIRNACAHSHGSRMEVELTYANDLAVRVADNGVGIDPSVLDHGRDGHFGLQGMRERANRIGARLTIVSSAESGTQVTAVVPGRIVFRRIRQGPFRKINTRFKRNKRTPSQ